MIKFITFDTWFLELFHDANRDPMIEAEIKCTALAAWNQAVEYSKDIIVDMHDYDEVYQVELYKQDALKQIEKLKP